MQKKRKRKLNYERIIGCAAIISTLLGSCNANAHARRLDRELAEQRRDYMSQVGDLKVKLNSANDRIAELETNEQISDGTIKYILEDPAEEAAPEQEDEVSPTIEIEPERIGSGIAMCGIEHSGHIRYMDYKCITDVNSAQYKLLNGGELIYGDDGLIRDSNGYVAVAMASRYGKIGDKFIISTSTGNRYGVIKTDAKADIHTVDQCHAASDASVVEFVIDTNKCKTSYSYAIQMGDFGVLEQYAGVVVSVEKVD